MALESFFTALLFLPTLTFAVLVDIGITSEPYFLMNSFTGSKSPLMAVNITSPLPWTTATNPTKPGSATSLTFSIRDRGIDPATGNTLASFCDIRFTPDMQQQHCLDVQSVGSGETRAVIQTNAGNPPGQVWMIHRTGKPSWPYKLSNTVVGPTRFLDTYFDTHEAFLSEGDYSGQYWGAVLSSAPPPPPPPPPPRVKIPKVKCNPPTHCKHLCSTLCIYYLSIA